jgi:hypothetical protein
MERVEKVLQFANVVEKFENVSHLMCEYQRSNGAVGCCATNCLYLADALKNSCKFNVRVEAVFVLGVHNGKISKTDLKRAVFDIEPCGDYDDTIRIIAGHLIVKIYDDWGNEHVFDPSYESVSIEDRAFCRTVSEFLKAMSYESRPEIKPQMKVAVDKFLKIHSIAQLINDGEFMLSDLGDKATSRKYYNDQADYVEIRASNHS